MENEKKPWYERLSSPLKRAFRRAREEPLAPSPPQGYLYDESAFVLFEEAALDEDVNPRTRRSRAGFTGCAEFRYVQTPFHLDMPFAVDQNGKKMAGTFSVEYDMLARRAKNLRKNGICPSQTEKAILDLDAKLNALRRQAGLNGRLLSFPSATP